MLVDACLALKGRTCHLCGLPGADSADHEPPRSTLLEAGVLNPDDLRFLFPSHRLPCNVSRGKRPITAELRVELRAKREAMIARHAARANLSPRFAARRPSSLRAGGHGSPATPSFLSTGTPEKNDESERP
ncbi:hypothetical protein [Aeromicrobium fastidiosum]|uniref:hypothetical protein n=1 Tax=Aeromicrobium fastidiosum TaxID=52699 RepID=UPI00100F1262|nr:hypothetical protein [Aeromicrobium fastidiosum]